MNVFQNIENYNPKSKCILTIGTFDGVHVGHQKIIKSLVELAQKRNLQATILTFFPHPRMVLQKESDIKLIDTPVCYLMFSACGGSLAFLSMLALFGQTIPGILPKITFAFLTGTWALKFAWWWALDHSVSVSTVETATGLGAFGKVRSLMPPHTSENYLQKEMGFVVARRHAIDRKSVV